MSICLCVQPRFRQSIEYMTPRAYDRIGSRKTPSPSLRDPACVHSPDGSHILRVLIPTTTKTMVNSISGITLKQTLIASEVVNVEDELSNSNIREETP